MIRRAVWTVLRKEQHSRIRGLLRARGTALAPALSGNGPAFWMNGSPGPELGEPLADEDAGRP